MAVMKPQTATNKSTAPKEFEKEATYDFGKTVIVVDSVFRQGGASTINDILARLICADKDGI